MKWRRKRKTFGQGGGLSRLHIVAKEDGDKTPKLVDKQNAGHKLPDMDCVPETF